MPDGSMREVERQKERTFESKLTTNLRTNGQIQTHAYSPTTNAQKRGSGFVSHKH